MSTHRRGSPGQVVILALVFMTIFITMLGGLVGYAYSFAKLERQTIHQAQALALAEAGIDKAIYSLNTDQSYTGETDTPLGSGTFSITTETVDANTKKITATGYIPNSSSPLATKRVKVTSRIDTSIVSFRFAIQSGNGGFTLQNSSSITGNVYSAGPVIGTGGTSQCNGVSGFGNCIFGDVVSAGGSGLVYGVFSTSSIFAHTVGNASVKTTAKNDIYYATSSTNVYDATGFPIDSSHKHANSTDKPTAQLPIADSLLDSWETDAAAGGTMTSGQCDSYSAPSNTCTITSSKSLGPIKVPFNLLIKSSSGILTVTGPIWVVGNITLQTGPTLRMDSALGGTNVAVIADDPANRNTSGVISIGQSTNFQGSGTAGSYVFMVARNTSAENNVTNDVCSNGSLDAICMNQSSSALVAYASHGQISFSQSASVKSATAYRIVLQNSANAIYDTGLPATMFEAGSGGSWIFIPGTYSIVP